MDSKNRILNRGGFTAALICLFVSACGPNGGMDSGMMTDAGPPMGDSGPDMPDAYMPPDGGMDVPDTGTVGDCTPEMMRDRVTPPCDPDTRTGAGTGPTGLEGLVGGANEWYSSSGSCSNSMGSDSMDRVGLSMACNENRDIAPYYGVYIYDRDGDWYANYQNRATQEWSHLRVDPGPIAVVELFHAGETTPYLTFSASP